MLPKDNIALLINHSLCPENVGVFHREDFEGDLPHSGGSNPDPGLGTNHTQRSICTDLLLSSEEKLKWLLADSDGETAADDIKV